MTRATATAKPTKQWHDMPLKFGNFHRVLRREPLVCRWERISLQRHSGHEDHYRGRQAASKNVF